MRHLGKPCALHGTEARLQGVRTGPSIYVFAQESDDEPYLSIDDQEAILDKAADEIINATVIEEHQEDSPPGASETVRPCQGGSQ
jgi:hypothetical protein